MYYHSCLQYNESKRGIFYNVYCYFIQLSKGFSYCNQLCVCVYGGRGRKNVHVRAQRLSDTVFLYQFPICFLRQGLFIDILFHWFPNQEAPGICLSLPHPGVIVLASLFVFYLGMKGLNWNPFNHFIHIFISPIPFSAIVHDLIS